MTTTSLITGVERAEVVADGLDFPTSVTFDPSGTAYVAESGLPFGGAEPGGRVWRVEPDGARTLLARGLGAPVNGLVFHDGSLIVSGGDDPGYITRLDLDGTLTPILDGLPGPGNYHTNMVAPGPDGKLYFSQGSLTNLAVVGTDAYDLGWLMRLPHAVDIPGYEVELTGFAAETPDPTSSDPQATTRTGAFSQFGTALPAGTRIPAGVPCTAAVMRCNPDGSDLELVAWGIRNAYGIGFLPDGRLLATDQSSDDRGSRPILNVPELIFEVREGAWYGWPDFIGGVPVTDPRFRPTRGPHPTFVLANHDELPPPEPPVCVLPTNSSATKFDAAPPSAGPLAGKLVVALFGDERPMTAPPGPRVGRSVIVVDPADWSYRPFARGFRRPIDVRFSPDGALHVVDFGELDMLGGGRLDARAGSGRLWRLEGLGAADAE
ncbi:MAG: sugar dehydrogenase [Actinomycetota bacterium]